MVGFAVAVKMVSMMDRGFWLVAWLAAMMAMDGF